MRFYNILMTIWDIDTEPDCLNRRLLNLLLRLVTHYLQRLVTSLLLKDYEIKSIDWRDCPDSQIHSD